VAVRLLAVREYCAAELQHKLQDRGFAAEDIRGVLEQLADAGYLSEQRFAESFLRSRMRKGETPRVAAYRARQRGVDEVVLSEVLRATEAGFDAEEACRALLARRDPQHLRCDDARIWQKHARFLRNKGFDAATVLRVMNETPDRGEENDEDEGIHENIGNS